MNNDKCCEKCYGRQGTRAGGGIYCLDKDCPCHTPPQEELEQAGRIIDWKPEEVRKIFSKLPQEEPWVAEFRREFPRGSSYNGKTVIVDIPKIHDALKSFIQKTLETDRKERAGVVLREVKEGLPEFEVDTAGGKRAVIMKDDLEDLLETVMK